MPKREDCADIRSTCMRTAIERSADLVVEGTCGGGGGSTQEDIGQTGEK